MVTVHKDWIEMHTKSTSYLLSTGRDKLVENIYYGARIQVGSPQPLLKKADAGYGGDVLRKKGVAALSSLCLEISAVQRGDYRRGALQAVMPHGALTSDFSFKTAVVGKQAAPAAGMPQGRNPDEVLCLTLGEKSGLQVELFYSVFYDADVITKKMRVSNLSKNKVTLNRCMSQQLDLPRCDFTIFSLHGAWAREAQLTQRPAVPGTTLLGNGTGASGNRCNPFFFIAENDATEHAGEVYGFNLVYSGSHEATIEVDSHGHTRVLQGIWSDGFAWDLAPGEDFCTPEAVLTYSDKGKNGMSRNMHNFVKNHIVPPRWQNAPRPVLVNNWEGTYFKFTETKLLKMAKEAAKLGVELFVLDDGWFGQRNDDTKGLGDYSVNQKKIPSGMAGLARKIKSYGMDFGLWFEPEMVNPDSDLYRSRPDWIIETPGYQPCTGRHQYVLDLCRPEVRQYIIRSVGRVLDSADISYVKWDMNRHISDAYSPVLSQQGEFMHRYTLGLYDLFQQICLTRPDILFEGCSSGGNRFDLGVLYYMPQIWTSDDSDAHERQRIQTGTSYGYPQSVMGCHVSAVPNHQTLRNTPLETRFNTAVFGLLGYELDPTALTAQEKADVKSQIEYYKQHRELLQFGDFYRLQVPFYEDGCSWIVVSQDKREAVMGNFINLLVPNSFTPAIKMKGLEQEWLYNVEVRRQKISLDTFGGLVNYVLPVRVNPDGALLKAAGKMYRLTTEEEKYTAYGSLLCKAGIQHLQDFSGAGYHEDMRFMQDFASRLYYISKV